MQVCISPHFGVICERLLTADETFPFIGSIFARRRLRCKADSSALSACCPQTPVPQSPTVPRERAVSAIDVAMQQVPAEIWTAFERRLDRARVPAPQRPDYHKWVCFYFQPPPTPPPAQRRFPEPPRATNQGGPAAPLPRADGDLSGGHGSAPARAAAPGRAASWEQ
jgi:hypothetical protein